MSKDKQPYVNLELPGIMGMGAVGPTLATMTAMLYSAVAVSMDNPPHWAYAGIMLTLSGLLAIFPTVKAKFSIKLRLAMWPIATTIVFASAWGVNHGLSSAESALTQDDGHGHAGWSMPTLVTTVYAGTTKAVPHPSEVKGVKVNKVDFVRIDHAKKTKQPESFKKKVKVGVWGYQTTVAAYLRDEKGDWYAYRLKPKVASVSPPGGQQQQQVRPPKGGFFKRY